MNKLFLKKGLPLLTVTLSLASSFFIVNSAHAIAPPEIIIFVNPPAPVVTISASPSTITEGDTSVITYNATNTEQGCTKSGDWSGPAPESGSDTVGPLSVGTYTYILTCEGHLARPGGGEVVVTVNPRPYGSGGLVTTSPDLPTPTDVNSNGSETLLTPPPTLPLPAEKEGRVLGTEKFIFTLLLRMGSKGNEVTELQKFLNNAGDGPLVVDGKFGKKTKATVIKFQLANGLKGDGIVGPLTRAVLNK